MFDYKLPSRRQLSGRLLDLIFKREMGRIIALMSGVSGWALVTDGWSNVNGDSIINFLEEAVGAGAVIAIVTDNAANMKKAWKLVRMERKGMVCTGCAAHGMDLLIKDIFKMKFFKDVLDKAQALARFIRGRRGLWSRFRDTQKQLKKRGEKRRHVIAAIFSDTAFLRNYKGSDLEEATKTFKDEEFWQDAAVTVAIIRPINTSLAAFERDDCSISLVYHQFSWLRTHDAYTKSLDGCSAELQLQVLRAIEDRKKKICWKPLGIAHMLDQTKSMDGHNSKKLIADATELARKLELVDRSQEDTFHNKLQEFVLEKCSWKGTERLDNNRFSPLNWWSLPDTKYRLVQSFAKLLLSIPTSSASSERSWSIHEFIHTKLRNRLTPERVSRLVFVYTNIARKTEQRR
ncbi:uncharacterized protein PITG_19601 [Phytophthora infestans T30-4]|uniref:HAT C-terminal dimerisation domain-containing protein n=1 Tax=Phytophthora infestans (strain T30-4) TaxID=403677 RepID=D0P0C4_PHYIT|nr:uncharacterized protein PITG_19601 [Phytophthora infestans T30-4]EEY70302.1 conserved hypothetical protein [Phytophthora infestans T30-4]|eukprot:XP_002996924.1 conserved hypothetical protein [Phytophthora infestans T30-4]